MASASDRGGVISIWRAGWLETGIALSDFRLRTPLILTNGRNIAKLLSGGSRASNLSYHLLRGGQRGRWEAGNIEGKREMAMTVGRKVEAGEGKQTGAEGFYRLTYLLASWPGRL